MKKYAIRFPYSSFGLDKSVQFNYDGKEIYCTWYGGMVDQSCPREVLECVSVNLRTASRSLHEAYCRDAMNANESQEKGGG